jgi:hypothetical protein
VNTGNTSLGRDHAGCVTGGNNSTHAFRPYGLGNDYPGIVQALDLAIANQLNPTDLTAYTTTTDDAPDVRAMDSDYGDNGSNGWVDCPISNTGAGIRTMQNGQSMEWCRGQDMRFNSWYYFNRGYTEANVRRIACHESAHTVGMRHPR